MEDVVIDPRSIAVVTGASSGMGFACARRLGRRHALVLADIDGESLERAAAELREAGCIVTPVVLDVSGTEAAAALAATTRSRGRFRALVHAAGLSPTMADPRRIMEVNLVGTAMVERAFLPLAEDGTAAVLLASTAGHMIAAADHHDAAFGDPLGDGFWDAVAADIEDAGAAYAASKRGVIVYCEAVAPAWGARGARILSISPGIIATPMGTREFAGQPVMERIVAMSPINRWGRADEIAAAAEFLLSDEARFITGTDLRIDGGATPVVRKLMN